MSQKQVMPKSEDLSRSLERNAIWTFDTEFPTIFNKSCTYITFKSAGSCKAALRKFNLQPSAENLNNFKIHRAKTRRVIKTSKKTSWRNYVSKLKSSSKSKKVWDIIRKISGKNSSGPIKHLSKNHIKATNKKDIADLLANILKQCLIQQL